jgi:hypothetical protein
MQKINTNNIPEELKTLNNWVLWKLESDSKGKQTKIPYQINRRKAISNNKNTWSSFQKVIDSYTNNNGYYDGIGFMFSNSDYAGIDLDKCIADSTIDEVAKGMINRANSYTEISQSGTGVHIIVRGNIPSGVKRKEIEMYSQERYFTMTGNRVNENNIVDGQELLNELYAIYKGTSIKTPIKVTSKDKKEINIEELLAKALTSKNCFKIEAIYNGNWKEFYNSQSEADQALCNHLAFWLDKDFDSIDMAFENSGLYRDKWDREDYKTATINKAIASCEKSYQQSMGEHSNSESYSPIWEYNNCYWKNGSKNTNMPVSNFIIVPIKYIECIDDPSKSILDVLIITQNGEKMQRQYRASDFDKVSEFDKATNGFKTYFTGTIQDLKYLKVFIYSKVDKTIKGVSCGGMHLLDKEWYFIDKDGCLDSENNKTDNVLLIDSGDVISSNLINAEAINAEELKQISPYLLKFNNNNITINILGYIAGLFSKEKLRKSGIKYSHFFGSGEGGAGKSETLENIIIPLLGIENKPQSAAGCTKYATEKKASSNNTIPYIIEEYKPKRIGDYKVNLISNMLRDLYDGHTSIRGHQDMSIHELELVSPVIIMGEASTSETANIERSLMITFSKADSLVEERTAAYTALKNNPLLNKLGRSLLEKSLKLSVEDVKSLYDDCLVQVSSEIKTPRVRNTVANTLLGLTILWRTYSDLGLSFENETGISWLEIVEAVNSNAVEEILENTSSTLSIIDRTFEVFNNMFGMQYCKDGDTYLCKLIDDDTLAMQISTIYTFFTKFIQEYKIEGDWLSWNDFIKQLKKNDYCIAFNITLRFPKKYIPEKGEAKDKPLKGLKISLSKIDKKGIDINNIIEYVKYKDAF